MVVRPLWISIYGQLSLGRNLLEQMKDSDTMFGKPEWFQSKSLGWGLTPVRWQGWVYTAVWCTVMLAPFFLLLSSRLIPEAAIWLAASMGLLLLDVRKILRAMRAPERDELFVIDERTDVTQLETRNYDMRVRR